MAPHGAFAEQICINEFGVFPIPDEISFQLAASYQMAYGTSYHALVQRGDLSEAMRFNIRCSGGVGLAALDIVKAKGASCCRCFNRRKSKNMSRLWCR